MSKLERIVVVLVYVILCLGLGFCWRTCDPEVKPTKAKESPEVEEVWQR